MTNHKLPLSAHFHPASGEETDLVTITPPVAGELELEYRAVSFTADEAMIPEWGERLLGGAPQYLGRLFFDGQPLTVEAEEALVTYFDEDGNDGDSLEEKVDSTGEINVTWLVELLTANTDFPVAELLAAEGKPTRSHPGFWKSNGQSGTPLDERCRWTLKLISEYDRPTFFGSETQIFSFDFEARTLSWQHYFAPTVYAPKDEEEEEEFYGEPIDPASVKKALNVKDTTKAGDRLRQLGWNSVSPALRRRFIPALTELLSATNAKLRFKALYFLDQVAYDAGDAKEALVALCSDDDVVIRRHAMSALGKVGNLSDEELKAVTANLVNRQSRYDALMALAKSEELPLWVLGELRQVFEGKQNCCDFERAVNVAARFEGAEESILELLHDELLNVRLAALCVLRQQDYSDAARAVLESFLQDAEPRIRVYATLALVKVTPEIARETREDLVDLLDDRTVPEQDRSAACKALGVCDDLRDEEIQKIVDLMTQWDCIPAIATALKTSGQRGVDALRAKMEQVSESNRYYYAEVLRLLAIPEGVALAEEILDKADTDWRARVIAPRVLAAVNPPQTERLRETLGDSGRNLFDRAGAAHALADLGDLESAPQVLEVFLEADDYQATHALVRALAKIGAPVAVELAAIFLDRKRPRSFYAREALCGMGKRAEGAIPALTAALASNPDDPKIASIWTAITGNPEKLDLICTSLKAGNLAYPDQGYMRALQVLGSAAAPAVEVLMDIVDGASSAEQAVPILVAIGAPARAVLPRLREAAKRLSHFPAVAEAVSTLESC